MFLSASNLQSKQFCDSVTAQYGQLPVLVLNDNQACSRIFSNAGPVQHFYALISLCENYGLDGLLVKCCSWTVWCDCELALDLSLRVRETEAGNSLTWQVI
jgi:hypothetical protein